VLKQKPLSNEEFLRRVRDYLPMDAAVWDTDERGEPCCGPVSGETVENRLYVFDAEAVLSASHAIEEIALEEATGSLLATMQDFRHFAPHRERYWQLAATLDRVRVVARGRKRPPHGHLQFIPSGHETLRRFWTVLYEGAETHAMLICRQANEGDRFERRRFIGFYSFSAKLIAGVRRDLEQILAGKSSHMREFLRLMAIDQAAKRIDASFDREHKAVAAAIRKLKTDGDRYDSRRFAADLERSLNNLRELNAALPAQIKSSGQPVVA